MGHARAGVLCFGGRRRGAFGREDETQAGFSVARLHHLHGGSQPRSSVHSSTDVAEEHGLQVRLLNLPEPARSTQPQREGLGVTQLSSVVASEHEGATDVDVGEHPALPLIAFHSQPESLVHLFLLTVHGPHLPPFFLFS